MHACMPACTHMYLHVYAHHMSHGTRMIESRHVKQITLMIETHHTEPHKSRDTYDWDMSHVTHMIETWVTSHIWWVIQSHMSHVTRMIESRSTKTWHTWFNHITLRHMSRVTRVFESCGAPWDVSHILCVTRLKVSIETLRHWGTLTVETCGHIESRHVEFVWHVSIESSHTLSLVT